MDVSTALIHADTEAREDGAVSPDIAQGVNGAFDTAEEFRQSAGEPFNRRFYHRHGNPNHEQVASVVAELEHAERALVAASGMGAITTAVLTLVQSGDHVVAQRSHYVGVASLLRNVLPKFGVEITEVDQTDVAAFEQAMRPNTKLVMLETPSNPRLEITDLSACADVARRHGALSITDNTFATPINTRPIELGVDLSWHSATKYMGGHADLLAGVVAGSSRLIERMWDQQLIVGSILAPFNAWLLLRGLRTLGLRMERHNRNAQMLAEALERHPAITRVFYPGLRSAPGHDVAVEQMDGFGGIVSFEFDGGHEAADAFLTGLKLVRRAPSLGAVHSLAVQPEAYWGSHQLSSEELDSAGINPGLIRFATGIEHPDDLLEDVMGAVESATAVRA